MIIKNNISKYYKVAADLENTEAQEALNKISVEAENSLKEADEYYKNENYAQAIKSYKKATELGNVQAQEALDKVINDSKKLIEKAKEYYDNSNYADAIKYYNISNFVDHLLSKTY